MSETCVICGRPRADEWSRSRQSDQCYLKAAFERAGELGELLEDTSPQEEHDEFHRAREDAGRSQDECLAALKH